MDIRNKLLNCCSEEVRENLDNARRVEVDNMDEKALITAIKKAAVKSINKSVHRRNFHRTSQEADEDFDHWVTRLNKKMRLCDYNLACNVKDCPHEHNYGNILVEEAMIANMYDQDHVRPQGHQHLRVKVRDGDDNDGVG